MKFHSTYAEYFWVEENWVTEKQCAMPTIVPTYSPTEPVSCQHLVQINGQLF